MSKKEFNTFKYGNKTIMQEIETLPNGNRKITSRTINGILTDKYDDIRLKYIFGAQKLLTIREFFELIVGDRFEKKDYVLEIYRDFEKVRHCKTIDELMYYHKWASHFIPNTFYKWNDRTLENMRCCQWMAFDFELRKSNGKAFSPTEVYEIFNQTIGFAPTVIKPSKTVGNYHVFLKHTTINGKTESLYLYKRIQAKIIEIIGTDEGAKGPNHPYSLPTKDQKIFYYGDNTIDFDNLKEWWLQTIKEENKKVKFEPMKGSNVVSLTEHMVWNHEAIQKLMNGEFDGSRNEAGFTLALLFYAMNKSDKECFEFLKNEWYPNVPQQGKPYRLSELKASVRSAYSEKYHGPSKEKIEALTDVPFNLKIYKGTYVRTEKHNKKENQQAIFNYFRQQGGSVEMIKKELIEDICRTQKSPIGKELAFKSIERNLDKLKKEGRIHWETVKSGRHTTNKILFTFKDGIQTETSTIIEPDYNIYINGKVVSLD